MLCEHQTGAWEICNHNRTRVFNRCTINIPHDTDNVADWHVGVCVEMVCIRIANEGIFAYIKSTVLGHFIVSAKHVAFSRSVRCRKSTGKDILKINYKIKIFYDSYSSCTTTITRMYTNNLHKPNRVIIFQTTYYFEKFIVFAFKQ